MRLETDTNTVILSAIVMAGLIIILAIGGAYYYATAKAQAAFKNGLEEINDYSQTSHYGRAK